MLSLFRQRGLTSVIYGAIIVAMIAVFVIQFRPNSGQKTASINEACAATVRGRCIDPKEQRAAYRLLIPRDQQGNLMTGRAKSMGLIKIATDGLVDRELLCAEAERIGVTVSDEEVLDEIIAGFIHVSLPADRPDMAASLRVGDGRLYVGFKDPKTKEFDQKVYERTIRNLVGRSPTEFREGQARELLASKMRDIVRSPVRVSEGEALDNYINEKSSASLQYVTVSAQYIQKYATPVIDSDLEKWAADKENEKKIDELVAQRQASAQPKENHIRHILIRVDPGATTDQKSEALGKLAAAVAQLKRGDAFADVAREYSQDPGSGQQGGDVGDKTDGFVVPFRDAANALKPGEVTPAAIETQFGYHLIEKDDPTKADVIAAALKKDAARDLIVKARSGQAAHDLAASIQAEIKAGKSPDDAAKDAIAQVKGKSLPSAPLTIASAPKDSTDAGAASSSSKSDAGADGGAAASDGPIVPKIFTSENDPDRPQAQSSNDFNKGGDPISGLAIAETTKLTDWVFSSPDAKDGALYPEPIRGEDAFYVVVLKAKKAATKDEFVKDRDTYMQTLLAAKQAEALGIYIKRLREAAKGDIKIDETYVSDGRKGDGGIEDLPDDEDEP
jgi:peptidyl-prolyl cis-trans isomerase D